MKLFVLLEVLIMAFASDKNDFVKNNGDSKFIGAIYKENISKWEAHRWSTNEKKMVYSGPYEDEETAAHASDTLARKLMRNGEKCHWLNFPDDDTELDSDEEISTSIYIAVSYRKRDRVWVAQRWSKKEKRIIYNGTYKDEKTAAHASDTLARDLMTNGEENHKLNFPSDHIEVYPKATNTSKFIGVRFKGSTWQTKRYSRNEKKGIYNGSYKDEETAARASDTLARKLMKNGEKGHKLNFPNDDAEVHRQKRANYIGVSYNEKRSFWGASRHSKIKKKMVYNGTTYKDENTAARASDILAKKLMKNGEKGHKLNFPDDKTEMDPKEVKYKKKRKRQNYSENSDDGVLSD